MKIHRFTVEGLAQYAYAVSHAGELALIDPIRDISPYLDYAHREGLRITHILETHIHADFAAGSLALAAATGAQLALSAYTANERYQYAFPHRKLLTGDSLQIGDLHLEALHTPGHTPEHLSFLLRDIEEAPTALFTGDFLFAGALGRPDLLGDDAKLALAQDLYRSIHHRIAALPDALPVYPGHGAGSLCGAGLSDRTETTLGYERTHNPFFHLTEPDFVHQILASVPPMPAYYPRMKTLNAGGAPILPELPGARALSVAELQTLAPAATLLDVRSLEAFAAAHTPGAVNLSTAGNLSMWAGWLLDPAKPIILIGDGSPEEEARQALTRVGLDNILGYLEGGFSTWQQAGLPVQTVALVSPEQPLGNRLVLDVRNDSELASGSIPRSIPGSVHIALGDLPTGLVTLHPTRPILTVCESGYRASAAASLLQRAGFTDVTILVGGMSAWRQSQSRS
jgi:hydroxyacylglutathione hydrolase